MSANCRIVVTGEAGFTGSTQADRLLSDTWEVGAVDSFDVFHPSCLEPTSAVVEAATTNASRTSWMGSRTIARRRVCWSTLGITAP
jgi:nucleoside-diphosphate-sugar epimerase